MPRLFTPLQPQATITQCIMEVEGSAQIPNASCWQSVSRRAIKIRCRYTILKIDIREDIVQPALFTRVSGDKVVSKAEGKQLS